MLCYKVCRQQEFADPVVVNDLSRRLTQGTSLLKQEPEQQMHQMVDGVLLRFLLDEVFWFLGGFIRNLDNSQNQPSGTFMELHWKNPGRRGSNIAKWVQPRGGDDGFGDHLVHADAPP